MTGVRGVQRIHIARPRARRGGRPAFAVDEDEFTLAVRAADAVAPVEREAGAEPYARLHLVGGVDKSLDWQFVAALGAPEIPVDHYPPTAAGVHDALGAAGKGGGEAELLVAVDSPSHDEPGTELAAVAAVVGSGARSLLDPLASVAVPPAGGPGIDPPTELLERLASAHAGSSAVAFRFSVEVPPGLSTVIGRRLERAPVVVDRSGPASGRGSPTGIFQTGARLAARLGAAESGWMAAVDHGWVAAFLVGPGAGWTEDVAPLDSEEPTAPEVATGVAAVSEGAYVPRPTYVGNLSARWRLAATHCAACGTITFPPRARCRSCGATDRLTPTQLPKTELRVAAVTTVHPGAQPTEFDPLVATRGAYSVVLVEPVPGVRLTAQLAGPAGSRVAIGDRVDLELRRLYPMEGEWRYGLKAIARPKGLAAERPPPSTTSPSAT